MSRHSATRPVALLLPLGALVVGVVTLAACRRHEVTNTMSSRSVAEGQATAGQPLGAVAPVAPAGNAAMVGHPAGSSGHWDGMGGNHGAAAMGSGGSSGAMIHVATNMAAVSDPKEEESPSSILGKLHRTNLKEIEMGKLAEKQGNSKEVKSYGSTLVKDHTAADKRIMAFAKAEHIDLGAANEAMDKMKAESGTGFDAEFAKAMLHDHQHDIAEVTAVRDATKDTKLKSLLSSLLPVLQKHEETARKIIERTAGEQK